MEVSGAHRGAVAPMHGWRVCAHRPVCGRRGSKGRELLVAEAQFTLDAARAHVTRCQLCKACGCARARVRACLWAGAFAAVECARAFAVCLSLSLSLLLLLLLVCVCVCVRACVRACVRVCVWRTADDVGGASAAGSEVCATVWKSAA